jgi:hypothetical protein
MDVPLKQSLLNGSQTAIVDDIISYLGMDFDTFRRRYNLRWDPHFTSAGNALLARAMYSALVRHQLITPSASEDTLSYRSREKYWEAYDDWRKDFVNSFIFPEIDFEHFKNIHQLVGGLYPPRSFPIKSGAPLSLILKSSASASGLTLRGINAAQRAQLITCQITDQQTAKISLPAGKFEESIALAPRKDHSSPVIDIKVSCAEESCENIVLHRIGMNSDGAQRQPKSAH